LIDLGTQTSEYQGKEVVRRQCIIGWELPEEIIEDGDLKGAPFTVQNFYTSSLHEKSKLRHILIAWRGRDFTPEELKGFDAKNILGKPCMLSIVANENGNRIVSSVMASPKGTKVPAQINPSFFFSLDPNEFEPVVFEMLSPKIKAIVDAAALVGVERFVLDDGWFNLRRHDRAGLGDWVVDKSVWPEGLAPIIKYINDKGMEFGLWFEGEMINPDSDLYRAHPEWILHEAGRTPPLARNQQVLDITHPGAYEHVLNQTDAILSEYNIAYIKWDHNRVLVDAGHLGQAAIHNQTAAIYRLFAELKVRHPKLEIESCASGGGRIDLGVVDYVDRFWTSDNNDALERQTIQRWTGIAIPPELLGTHIGPRPGNQNRRTTEINFRAITALFGHAGIEWDITRATEHELEVIKSWVALYKRKRGLMHSGKAIRVDHPDQNSFIYGVIAHDKSEALFAVAARDMSQSIFPAMARIPGLDPDRIYKVRAIEDAGVGKTMQRGYPGWMLTSEGITMSGSELATIGLRPPILAPENAILIEISAAE
jgi:alpha-galactosidase